MGVNCKITLPPAARLQDVADVIGALAGMPCKQRDFGKGLKGWAAHVDGVTAESIKGLPTCANIEFDSPVDGSRHHVMYHFEWDRHGNRGLMPRSTPLWCAIGKGLVDFFGGSVDYNDWDAIAVDYSQPARDDIHAEDGAEWYAFQERKLAVQPISAEQL